jgi:hypothetical protein
MLVILPWRMLAGVAFASWDMVLGEGRIGVVLWRSYGSATLHRWLGGGLASGMLKIVMPTCTCFGRRGSSCLLLADPTNCR